MPDASDESDNEDWFWNHCDRTYFIVFSRDYWVYFVFSV
jgi:hypothetical protein